MQTLLRAIGLLLWAAVVPASAASFDHQHAMLDGLLKRQVISSDGGNRTQVRYAALAAERDLLKGYLRALEAVRPADYAAWTRGQKLAFLINAYNAWTLELILTRYPDLKSIRDLGSLFQSPWKKSFVPLLGKTRSLDEIEHGMIRQPGAFDEPRIHFAVNCASIGCPALRAEAYVAERLEAQLNDAARGFLADRSRNRYDLASDTLYVSKIFDWYGEDFERSSSLQAYFASQAQVLADDAAARAALRKQSFAIRYNDYDWALNDAR